MFYNNTICDGCKKPMHDDEDIVVCPVCGTPQHRECYDENGCCVNEKLHANGFVWQAPKQVEEKPEEADSTDNVPNSEPVLTKGPLLSPINTAEFNAIFMTGVNAAPNDEIDGVKVGEMAMYIQNGSRRFINKYLKRKGKKLTISWNWAAFFFNPYWFFYRKMYKVGFIFLCISVALNVAMVSQSEKLNTYYEDLISVRDEYNEKFKAYQDDQSEENTAAVEAVTEKMMQKSRQAMPTLALVFSVTVLAPNIVAALIANYLYKRKMLLDIEMAHKSSDDPKMVSLSLMRSGGVAWFATMGSIIAGTYLPSLLIGIVEKFVR